MADTPTPEMKFKFLEFNHRRHMRGEEAARVEVIDGDNSGWLWMSKSDIRKHIAWHGQDPELLKALEAYRG